MEKILFPLICASALIWLVDCGTKTKCISSVSSSDEEPFYPYKWKKTWNAENTPTNMTRYEEAHHEDFIKNECKYKVWPELNDEIPVTFCRKYIQKLFRSSTFLAEPIPLKLPSINLHYTRISGVNGDSLEPVNLAAVQCYLPKCSKRRHFLYIRAPRPQCVFLVKPLNRRAKSQFVNDFSIVNEFCEENDVIMDVVDSNCSQEHQCNQDIIIHDESDKGKWNIGEPIRRKTIPVPRKIRRKWLNEAPPENVVKYEIEHRDNYLVNKDKYETWPELETINTKTVCEKGLKKLFAGSIFKNVYPTVLGSVVLRYMNAAERHSPDLPRTVNVPILQCHVPDCLPRRYFFYIRTPRPQCLYVVKPLVRKMYTAFKIIDEFCDEFNLIRENSSLQLLAEVSVSRMTKKNKWNYESPFEDLLNYEKTHYNEYNDHKDIYEKWLELNTLNKEIFCKNYIKPLFPNIMSHVVDASIITSAKLHYQNVTDDDKRIVAPNEVTVLQCYWEKSYGIKFFHFIKSTTVYCVFLVKKLAKNLQRTDFKIFNQFCLGSYEYRKLMLTDI